MLNIVEMRYMDLPVFVEVASVVRDYSMATRPSDHLARITVPAQ